MDWLDTVFAIKHRTITLLLASLIFTLLGPLNIANASDPATPITTFKVQGVTPPVAGATPVSVIQENDQYSGTVTWSTNAGPLEGNFVSNTIYQATIIISPKAGYTLESMPNEFILDGAYIRDFDSSTGELIAIFQPTPLDAVEYLDPTFGLNGTINLKDIFGNSPQNESNTATSAVKVEQIAVDSQDRIIVLASFDSLRIDQNNDTYTVDNHILFRLNANGSYDNTFGDSENALFKEGDQDPKYYVSVVTTGISYIERLKLEIDDQDRILVMLSGFLQGSSGYHNFLARYTSDGILDTTFGDGEPGVIGSLSAIPDFPEALFANFTIDSQNKILIVSLTTPYGEFSELPEMTILRFTPEGELDDNFFSTGNSPSDTSTVFLDVNYPQFTSPAPDSALYSAQPSLLRQVQIISIGTAGYIVSYSDSSTLFNNEPNDEEFLFTQLFKIDYSGSVDESFVAPQNPFDSYPENKFIIPSFFLTDLEPDGNSGFFLSGTSFQFFDSQPDFYSLPFYGVVARFTLSGNIDLDFAPSGNPYLTPYLSSFCYNGALLRYNSSNSSIDGIVLADLCAGDSSGALKLKAFSYGGALRSELSIDSNPQNLEEIFIAQLESTSDGKVLVLRGAEPTQGLVGYIIQNQLQTPTDDPNYVPPTWTNIIISRYHIPDSNTPVNPPAPPTPAVQTPDPTPIPYLKTLSTPKLNFKDGNLVCTAGTYNAGYTLNGVVSGSSTSLFTPTSFTYKLLLNGVEKTSLTVTLATSTASWSLPTTATGTLITCSVTVNANGITNSDRSSDDASAISAAVTTHRSDIAKANSDYAEALNTNTKAYQKALVDNRANWRSATEKIRTDYYAERDRIRFMPSTKATRALSSNALKAYIAAQKISAADYKASQPAAAAARDAANKAALDTKNSALAKANAAYGAFIESIGYGVLVP